MLPKIDICYRIFKLPANYAVKRRLKMDNLDVVLAEYKALRDEITDKFRLYLQIYSMYASALLVFYGLIFVHKIYDLVMTIPIFSLALLYRILWEQTVINLIGRYIRTEIEEKRIPKLTGKMNAKKDQPLRYTDLWMGWQHFWQESPSPKYHQYSLLMLFLLLSVVPAILYNIYNIIAFFTTIPEVTILNIYFLVFVLILNLSLGCYTCYRIIKP